MLATSDYDYTLPSELIAQRPTPRRGESRLLQLRRHGDPALRDGVFGDLVSLIPPGDLLVVNNTKVRHARFLCERESGSPAEVLLIHPSAEPGVWVAMGKPGSALRPGKRLRIGSGWEIETVAILPDGERLVRFIGVSAEEAMSRWGRLPLPPYIRRAPDGEDDDRYQTVYADREGSVAAPTAGLHFTPTMLEALRARGVLIASLELEVGPGTFKPVETEDLASHTLHPERYTIPEDLAASSREVRARGGGIWAVGTTVVRALEAAADPRGRLTPGPAETSLFIRPGYRFRMVNHLITNFHLPRSTLLVLVAAFAGHEPIMAAYRHAVDARYRFYSYGDAMVVI
jgi:S-adenosylmethionine:tRNA ribosyltransferase-isomerase